MRILVTGAGGMIGGAMVERLLADGHDVRAIDKKPYRLWWRLHETENYMRDLMFLIDAQDACRGIDWVVDLAEDMGGIGYITGAHAECAITGAVIRSNMLRAAVENEVARYSFASSACVYRQDRQLDPDAPALAEVDAWPADPEPGYGLAKLYGEELCRYFRNDHGLRTTISRFHNIAGPPCTWEGGREKAPAAICRKVATAKLTGEDVIDIWGDGEQTRSFCWIGDCVDGVIRLADADYPEPVNIGSSEVVTINELVDHVERAAFGAPGTLERRYQPDAPQGVRGRNSDNTLCRSVLDWEPSTALGDWIPRLYEWVEGRVADQLRDVGP